MKQKLFLAAACGVFISLVLFGGGLLAQEAQPQAEDKGVWVITLAGQEAGRETFSRVPKEGGGWEHRSEASIRVGGTGVKFMSALDTGALGEPMRYALDVEQEGKGPTSVKVSFGEGSLTAHVEGLAEPVERTEPYEERPFVLDNNFFSHYFYLLQQFRASGQDKTLAFAYVPQALALIHIIVEREDDEETEFAGEKIVLHKIFMDAAGSVGMNIYFDAAGEPVKVDIPLQQVTAAREGYAPVPVGVAPAPEAAAEEGATAENAEAESPATKEEKKSALREEEAKFKNGSVELVGTLLLPPAEECAKGKKYPAAVILSGSGPQDRDGNTPGGGLSESFYRRIAERLASEGFTVLRFDDRGVGESGGSLDTVSVTDLKNDARAAVRWLQARKDIDKKDVAVIGHSEGAILALMLGSEKKPLVSRLVLLGGTSSPLNEVLREQLELVPAGEMRDLTRQSQDEIFALIETGKDVGLHHGQKINLKWFREHFAINPTDLARKTRIPVFILQAEKDRQVLSHHANRLYEALSQAGAPVKLEILPGLDHLYLSTPSGSLAEYGRTRKYGAEPFDSIVKWMREGRNRK